MLNIPTLLFFRYLHHFVILKYLQVDISIERLVIVLPTLSEYSVILMHLTYLL